VSGKLKFYIYNWEESTSIGFHRYVQPCQDSIFAKNISKIDLTPLK
jgi:hypothetical protein